MYFMFENVDLVHGCFLQYEFLKDVVGRVYLIDLYVPAGPVINKTDVTSSRCDRLAKMKHYDEISTSRRPF